MSKATLTLFTWPHRYAEERDRTSQQDVCYLKLAKAFNPFPHGPWKAAQPTASGLIGPPKTDDIMLIKDTSDDVRGADWTLPYLLISDLSVL
jgi:hypothetical protein